MLTVNIICKHGHYCLYTPVGTAADVEGLAEEAEAAAGSGSGDPGSLPSKEPVGSVMTILNINTTLHQSERHYFRLFIIKKQQHICPVVLLHLSTHLSLTALLVSPWFDPLLFSVSFKYVSLRLFHFLLHTSSE